MARINLIALGLALMVAAACREGRVHHLARDVSSPRAESSSVATTTARDTTSGVVPVMVSGNMKLQNFTWEQTGGGAPRATATYKPGDDVYAKYEVTGYSTNPQGQMELALSFVCTDPAGLRLAEPWQDTVRAQAASSINGSFQIHLPPFVPAGTYKLTLTVEDKANNTSADFSPTFTVETAAPIPPADHLEVRDFQFSHSKGGAAILPAEYRTGESVYYSFDLFGMTFRNEQPSVHIAYKLLSPKGEALFDKPDWENLRDTFVYHPANFFVPINGHLTLPSDAGPGTYIEQYVITDNNAQKTITQESKFSVK